MSQSTPGPTRPETAEDWKRVYDVVYQFYWVEDQTLKATMSYMLDKHNFCATEKQWISKLGEWNLKKNITSGEMENIVRIQNDRKSSDGKDTHFTVRGRPVPQEKIDRYLRRQKRDASIDVMSVPGSPQTASTPSDIQYETPPGSATEKGSSLQTSNGQVDVTAVGDSPSPRLMSSSTCVDIDWPSYGRLPVQGPSDVMDIDETYLTDASESSVVAVEGHEFATAVRDARRAAMGKRSSKVGLDASSRALREAVRANNPWLVQQQLNSGARADDCSKTGMNALHIAAFYGRTEIVDLLAQAHTDLETPAHGTVEIRRRGKWARKVAILVNPCPIHLAVSQGHLDIVKTLLTRGTIVDSRDTYKTTPLILAAHLGFGDIARLLIDWGANPKCANQWGETAVTIAGMTRGSADMIHLLRMAEARIVTSGREQQREKGTRGPLPWARVHPRALAL